MVTSTSAASSSPDSHREPTRTSAELNAGIHIEYGRSRVALSAQAAGGNRPLRLAAVLELGSCAEWEVTP
jgi:hypothetical protein